jgi:L-asparaginase II
MILAEVVRSGFVESVHHGSVIVLDATGQVVAEAGDVTGPSFPRSSNKPLQTVGMLRAGLRTAEPADLALISGSHFGEPFHVARTRRILTAAGLDESDLRCPPSLPLSETERDIILRAGGGATPILMNCSGKHAGMLGTTVRNSWPVTTYRDPDHPTQLAILQTIDDLAGEQATGVAVDGCGAPLFALSLYGLARAFGRIAAAADGPERQVADAIRTHPEWTSGTRRDELALHRAIPGLMGKAGAEAVYAVGLPDGRGVALKISDGSPRARAVAMAGVLQRLGFEHDTLVEQASAPVLGHGERVGEIRPAADALAALGQ